MRFFSILIFVASWQYLQAQLCVNEVGCDDCYTWCRQEFIKKSICNSPEKAFCKKSCNLCPTNTDVCQELRCTQRCVLSEDRRSGRCECFNGFNLGSDGRTCEEIDECKIIPSVCTDERAPFCINTPGSYTCTRCGALPGGLRNYYNSSECCKKHANNYNQCGFSSTNGRVVGGKLAAAARWPWMAYIKAGKERCGGSLLTRDWVVTSAHCVHEFPLREISVVLGAVNTSETGSVNIQTKGVSRVVLHPNHDFPRNDVALLRLSTPANLGRYVGMVCLPNGHEPVLGQKCFATGYGTTSFRGEPSGHLKEVGLPIVNTDLCRDTYQNETHTVDSVKHICAGYEQGGKDACQGDSGGPLVCQRCNDCDWYIAGIISFGKGCAMPGFYGVYTNVVQYEEWMARITAQEITQRRCVRPEWHAWGGWTRCNAACGGGARSRSRYCISGNPGDPACIGEANEVVSCNTEACPVTSWGSWVVEACSVTCGRGTRIKQRVCENGNIGDIGCEVGGGRMQENCTRSSCPSWSEWESWTGCPRECGGAFRTRRRSCSSHGVTNANCSGSNMQREQCNTHSCFRPTNTGDRRWSSWGECSVRCGGGRQQRSRNLEIRQRSCNNHSCPAWGNWGEWGACSVTCGGGKRSASRSCNTFGRRGAICDGEENRTEDCQTQSCPRWAAYGEWSDCDVTCGGGSRSRRRDCLHGRVGEIGCHDGTDVQNQSCNNHSCPAWGNWGEWGACSVTCGGGRRSASRSCNTFGRRGASCDGEANRMEDCQTQSCPRWAAYGEWSDCDVTCGGGSRSRRRDCLHGSVGEIGCHDGTDVESRSCNNNRCPAWGNWGEWGACSVTCGGGRRSASRSCNTFGRRGASCDGEANRMEDCQTQSCPHWSKWKKWGECNATCGGGLQERLRDCIGGEVEQLGCSGSGSKRRACNTKACCTGRCCGKVNNIDEAECSTFILRRYCVTFFTYMQSNCELACCQHQHGELPCADVHPSCPHWATNCANIPFVRANCRFTCGLCNN